MGEAKRDGNRGGDARQRDAGGEAELALGRLGVTQLNRSFSLQRDSDPPAPGGCGAARSDDDGGCDAWMKAPGDRLCAIPLLKRTYFNKIDIYLYYCSKIYKVR